MLLVIVAVALSACGPDTAPGSTAAAPAVPPVSFDDAVANAANTVFSSAPAALDSRQTVVIDPLVDGVTGAQTAATKHIGTRIADLVKRDYPRFNVQPFSPDAVAQKPYVLVGTFTPVNAQGQTSGEREAFRFCLVLADLRSGRTVAKGVARAKPAGVDSTPDGFFRDMPVWTDDASVKSYISTCQATKVGDPINPVYINGIETSSIVSQAITAYDEKHYRDALALYRKAEALPTGRQWRVYGGIYASDWKLGRQAEAAEDFARLVDYGIDNNRLAIPFLFRPGSIALADNPSTGSYELWLKQIAARSSAKDICLRLTGHTSKSGSPEQNERLSLLRAGYVRSRLLSYDHALQNRIMVDGAGARETLVGTGADNVSDMLDRRVEFKPIPKC